MVFVLINTNGVTFAVNYCGGHTIIFPLTLRAAQSRLIFECRVGGREIIKKKNKQLTVSAGMLDHTVNTVNKFQYKQKTVRLILTKKPK